MADPCYTSEIYLSHEIYEVIALVVTNLFLVFPLWKAYNLHEYTRAFLLLCSITFSSLYHLCKTSTADPDGSLCVLSLCALKLLDYTFSYTILNSSLLYLLDFGAVYKHLNFYHTHSKKFEVKKHFKPQSFHPWKGGITGNVGLTEGLKSVEPSLKNEEYLVKPDMTYVEDYFIYLSVLYNAISVYTNGFTSLTIIQLIILLGITILILVLGWTYIYSYYHIYPHYDTIDLIISIILATIGIILFLVADYLPVSSYWITHSLWHIFVSFSNLYLLEARNFRKSGWSVLCFDSIKEY
jgi:hypothetical protein